MHSHLGRPGILSTGTTWRRCLKVVPRVVSIPDHPFFPIAKRVVGLIHDRSSPLIVGPVPPHVSVMLVMSCLNLVSACAPNRLPLVHPKCRDCFGSLNGCCAHYPSLLNG